MLAEQARQGGAAVSHRELAITVLLPGFWPDLHFVVTSGHEGAWEIYTGENLDFVTEQIKIGWFGI